MKKFDMLVEWGLRSTITGEQTKEMGLPTPDEVS